MADEWNKEREKKNLELQDKAADTLLLLQKTHRKSIQDILIQDKWQIRHFFDLAHRMQSAIEDGRHGTVRGMVASAIEEAYDPISSAGLGVTASSQMLRSRIPASQVRMWGVPQEWKWRPVQKQVAAFSSKREKVREKLQKALRAKDVFNVINSKKQHSGIDKTDAQVLDELEKAVDEIRPEKSSGKAKAKCKSKAKSQPKGKAKANASKAKAAAAVPAASSSSASAGRGKNKSTAGSAAAAKPQETVEQMATSKSGGANPKSKDKVKGTASAAAGASASSAPSSKQKASSSLELKAAKKKIAKTKKGAAAAKAAPAPVVKLRGKLAKRAFMEEATRRAKGKVGKANALGAGWNALKHAIAAEKEIAIAARKNKKKKSSSPAADIGEAEAEDDEIERDDVDGKSEREFASRDDDGDADAGGDEDSDCDSGLEEEAPAGEDEEAPDDDDVDEEPEQELANGSSYHYLAGVEEEVPEPAEITAESVLLVRFRRGSALINRNSVFGELAPPGFAAEPEDEEEQEFLLPRERDESTLTHRSSGSKAETWYVVPFVEGSNGRFAGIEAQPALTKRRQPAGGADAENAGDDFFDTGPDAEVFAFLDSGPTEPCLRFTMNFENNKLMGSRFMSCMDPSMVEGWSPDVETKFFCGVWGPAGENRGGDVFEVRDVAPLCFDEEELQTADAKLQAERDLMAEDGDGAANQQKPAPAAPKTKRKNKIPGIHILMWKNQP
eukprot:g15254.t1